MSKTTVTAALPYANGPVHIGHVAGVYLPADIYVRYLRNCGRDVLFICGSDEHGVPITIRARKEGVTPQEIVDRFHNIIGKSFKDLGISFDIYSRTSSATHKETAQDFFKNLYDKNVFTEETTEQYFDVEANQFLADRYIIGTCPVCANTNAYGDQCEKCGSTLSPMELKDPRSALSGNAPVLKATKNWFLPLDKIQDDFLNQYINGNSNWKSNVLGQCKSWLNDGLKPRAMTRDLDWGVPVPLADTEGKVLYVWFEAPIGYISATRELRPNDWQDWWKGDTQLVHFIGKDNIVFHCIIFPAMLHLRGDGFVVPSQVPANEFLNLEGDKISTSRNWAVWLNEYLEDFAGKQDELRYVLGSILPETKDSEFTWKDFQTRVNSELVSIFANFTNRVMVLTHKFFDGKVPETGTGIYGVQIDNCRQELQDCLNNMRSALDNYRFRDALGELMNMARVGNRFLTETEPWKVMKENPKAAGEALNFSLEICANLAFACEPFLPFTHQKLCAQLNLLPLEYLVQAFWAHGKLHGAVPSGQVLSAPEHLFSKIEDEAIEQQIQKLNAMKIPISVESQSAVVQQETQTKAEIQYEDFAKMDLRIATVEGAEKVEKADKLLKLTLNAGGKTHTVVSGIALHYKPEEVVGKQVVWLSNLAPRKMRGIESEGMILMAEDLDGKLVFVSPAEVVASGSGVG